MFEENSAVFFERARKRGEEPPQFAGYRAIWPERALLAVAKHADKLAVDCQSDQYSTILMRSGTDSGEDDVFVEVHIYGPVSRRTLDEVTFRSTSGTVPSLLKDIRDRLAAVGVKVRET